MSTGPVRSLVVIPAFNEAKALPRTLEELQRDQPGLDIVVIDDGSSDDTADVAAVAGIPVVRLPFNLGVGGAVRTGLRYSVEHDYDRTVVFDADGQHDPSSIKVLLDTLDDGADMVVGSRFLADDDHYRTGHTRRRAMGLLTRLVTWSTGQAFTDTTSGFRSFDRRTTALLARAYPVEYLADTVEVLVMLCRAGYRVEEVAVTMRPRAEGEPSSRSWKLVVNYLRLLVGIVASATKPRPRKDVQP